ncbi:MAG: hypothetical protein J0H88_05300 [Sphingomonadales bacterium]|nr:hypothetical protein [Sphingomonadales bacterium]
MARVHSPGYPNMSLPKAIAAVRKIFSADRRNPIDRVVAAKHIGYSGQSGASDKALASLAHYGLTEKTGKGEIKVSQLAVDIIHPESPSQEAASLMRAGFNPQVFKDIYQRFDGHHVSEDALRSYLVRENFQDIAINPVMNSFYETCRFLEQEKAFESGSAGGNLDAESDQSSDDRTNEMNDTATIERPNPPAPKGRETPAAPSTLNRIDMDIKGNQVHLNALLDLNGLSALEKKIKALKILLEVHDDETGEDNEDENNGL